MMMGLGVGGVSVGMFHLITHAFFKALLFLGAGSVIHGCSGEQDIRRMGGLRKYMPVTFAVYTAGMLALCGFPFFFSGFWSKDAILHAAHNWSVSQIPFYMGALGAFLTAFYMTRQVYYVFAGSNRLAATSHDDPQLASHFEDPTHHAAHHPARKPRGHDHPPDDPRRLRRASRLHRHARVAVVPILPRRQPPPRSASPASQSPASSPS